VVHDLLKGLDVTLQVIDCACRSNALALGDSIDPKQTFLR